MANIKKGDTVIVIAGKDKGKTGRVLQVLRDQDRVIVEVSVESPSTSSQDKLLAVHARVASRLSKPRSTSLTFSSMTQRPSVGSASDPASKR